MTLETVREEIEKKYGLNTSLDKVISNVESIPTGIISLDKILGVGGLPKGRIIEIYGEEASGKTFITLMSMASVQQNGGKVCFIDVEQAFDNKWAAVQGVQLDGENLLFVQPDFAEQALDIAIEAAEGGIDLIVLDSIAALVPQVEAQGEVADQHMGVTARLMGKFCRKIAPHLNNNKSTVIMINQLRDKIGIVYGNPKVTTGGHAMKFAASVRLLTSTNASSKIEDKGNYIGQKIKVKVTKNKVGSPYRETTFNINFNDGYSSLENIIDLAIEYGFIDKRGGWLQYNEPDLSTGEITEHKARRTDLVDLFTSNPDKLANLEQRVMDYKEDNVQRIAMDEPI